MIDREQLYEAFDDGIIGLDDIIDISQKDGYNQSLVDFISEIEKQTTFYCGKDSHLRKIVEQLKR